MNKHNKRIIVVTVILVIFSIVTLLTSRQPSPIETIFKDTIANIEYYLIKAPIQYVSGLFNEYTELKDVYEENEKLKRQLDDLAKESATNEVLTSELNQLKEITQIDYLPTDYFNCDNTVFHVISGNYDLEDLNLLNCYNNRFHNSIRGYCYV